MGQPKTPGTMLRNGYTDTNVNEVLAAGSYPWNNLFISHWFSKGCFHWTSPEAEPPGSDATKGGLSLSKRLPSQIRCLTIHPVVARPYA
jgi:hypothetical protein